MRNEFYAHPLWINCHDRPIWVVSLSESEHRLRDARALMHLRDFLPPHTTYSSVTVEQGEPKWPTIPRDAAIVLIGRPSLFGGKAEQLLAETLPPLLFHFLSDDPSSPEYRSVVERPSMEITPGETFDEQRGRKEKELRDLGIIYCGHADKHPLFLFAGSSTVGTWGAVSYACERVIEEGDLRWQNDVQGTLRTQVRNTREAFDNVSVRAQTMLAPARFWMSGRDLPPLRQWREAIRLSDNVPKGGAYDLRILCNGNEILKNARTPIAALTLLAWVSQRPRNASEFFLSETTVGDVVRRLRDFDGFDSREQLVRSNLRRLVQQIRKSGGIAYEESQPIQPGNQEAHTKYWLCARHLPSFLPSQI